MNTLDSFHDLGLLVVVQHETLNNNYMSDVKTPVAAKDSVIHRFVAGYTVVNGQVSITVKDKVSKNPLRRVPCSHCTSFFLVKGVTLDEAKLNYPLGMNVDGEVDYGEERISTFPNSTTILHTAISID